MPKSLIGLAAKAGILMAVFGFAVGVGLKIKASIPRTTDTAYQQEASRGENDGRYLHGENEGTYLAGQK